VGAAATVQCVCTGCYSWGAEKLGANIVNGLMMKMEQPGGCWCDSLNLFWGALSGAACVAA
jgi:hypothetical protein